MPRPFAETMADTISGFAHSHLVAPMDYDEPETSDDGSKWGIGVRLLLASAALVLSIAASFVWLF